MSLILQKNIIRFIQTQCIFSVVEELKEPRNRTLRIMVMILFKRVK